MRKMKPSGTKQHRTLPVSLLLVVLAMLSGCARPDVKSPVQQEPGYIALLPGVGGYSWEFVDTVKGLREAGIHREIEIIDWHGGPLGTFWNLTDIETNRQRAEAIAARISAYHREHPDHPITLVGYSGGGGLAALIVSSLDEDVTVDQVILIAAALSPDYDLTPVLSRCRRGLVNYFSVGDWLILGFGTKLFGTIDRVSTDSAGHIGFVDAHGDTNKAGKLHQFAWVPDWSDLGHDGGHVGWLAKDWAREVLARQIVPEDEPVASAIP